MIAVGIFSGIFFAPTVPTEEPEEPKLAHFSTQKSGMAALRALQSHVMPVRGIPEALSERGFWARFEETVIRVFLVHKDGISLWSELRLDMSPYAHLLMSFGCGMHDASWLYVCAEDRRENTLLVRVFDVGVEEHYTELDSFELARQDARYCLRVVACKPWVAVLFIQRPDILALYRQGEREPVWVHREDLCDHPRFTRDGLHVAIMNRRVFELLCLREGQPQGSVIQDISPPPTTDILPRPFQLQDGSWLMIETDGRTVVHNGRAVHKLDQNLFGEFWDFSVAPSLGVIVTNGSKVVVLTTPDHANMDAMSECRVAWMVAAVIVCNWAKPLPERAHN